MTETIVVFDIGKTNKKVLLFDKNLKLVYEFEEKFEPVMDENGFECDDIRKIERWIFETLDDLLQNQNYFIKGVNFSTYGASLVYLDENGKTLTPVYNYLKPMPRSITERLYERFGGIEEFSRKTASPALGFLNSGLQILWLKRTKPEVFCQVKHILHLPQYCSYLLTAKTLSEYTSIGCHTAMWDFDNMVYHPWLKAEGIHLPLPVSNNETFVSRIAEYSFMVGTGIHDSSASLAPYILESPEKFILISTGTWCISMNPFNDEPLTSEQLESDCLSYMSIRKKPVKSSRLFMGHMHDVNLEIINQHFHKDAEAFKTVKPDHTIIGRLCGQQNQFFKNGIPENYVDHDVDLSSFSSFEEAYHRLIIDLTNLCFESIQLILPKNDDSKHVYISGGFSKNNIFTHFLASKMSNKRVFTSEIDNATALGAAMVVYTESGLGSLPGIDLGLKEVMHGQDT